jgi:hypothetical protein
MMSKFIVTFTFTDSVEVDLSQYVGQAMPDNRIIELARESLAENYDDAGIGGAYLLLGDAGADLEII